MPCGVQYDNQLYSSLQRSKPEWSPNEGCVSRVCRLGIWLSTPQRKFHFENPDFGGLKQVVSKNILGRINNLWDVDRIVRSTCLFTTQR